MAQTHSRLWVHVVFSTKDRLPLLWAEIRRDLFAYISGMVREFDQTPVIVNGVADHVHMVFSLPPKVPLAEALRIVKARSSRWLRRTSRAFAWQPGYGAFRVSQSHLDDVKRYVASQEKHYRRLRFQDEFLSLLKKHEIAYDERYLWR